MSERITFSVPYCFLRHPYTRWHCCFNSRSLEFQDFNLTSASAPVPHLTARGHLQRPKHDIEWDGKGWFWHATRRLALFAPKLYRGTRALSCPPATPPTILYGSSSACVRPIVTQNGFLSLVHNENNWKQKHMSVIFHSCPWCHNSIFQKNIKNVMEIIEVESLKSLLLGSFRSTKQQLKNQLDQNPSTVCGHCGKDFFSWTCTSAGELSAWGRVPVMRIRGLSWGGCGQQFSWSFHLLICLRREANLPPLKLRQPWHDRPNTAAARTHVSFMAASGP